MPDSILKTTGLQCRRGDFTLQVDQWSIAPGQVVGIVGPNGAGKTTLLRTLYGLDQPDAGEVLMFGKNPATHVSECRSQAAMMWDDQPIFSLPIGNLLNLVSGYYPTWDHALVQQLLERFSLDSKAHADTLSKGNATKLRLLLAMAFRPKLLILDEPALGLDIRGRQNLLESMIDVAGDGDRSVIISSHSLSDIERICDRLLVISEGRVLQDGPIETLVHEDKNLEEMMMKWGAA